jgi:hypothetical protein
VCEGCARGLILHGSSLTLPAPPSLDRAG